MLSRIAANLHWMSRYVERAENTARVLDVTYRVGLVNKNRATAERDWYAPLNITGTLFPFQGRYPQVSADTVLTFMALDSENPTSILSCVRGARENARTVRSHLTTEMWEVLNSTWLELSRTTEADLRHNPQAFFDYVKERSHLYRGVTLGTMHRGDAYHFLRLGTFIERADATARLIDVKYHLLLPSLKDVGRAIDYYQWGAILRALSAFETYKRIYRDVITPIRIAELLILRDDFPRSLAFSLSDVHRTLLKLEGARNSEVLRVSGRLDAQLRYGRIQDIFANGLHEYLTDFLVRIGDLSEELQARYFTLSGQIEEAAQGGRSIGPALQD